MNNSIFGSGSPKFVYDINGAAEATVLLDYWVPIKEDADVKEVLQESELLADRIFIDRGEFLEIEGRINLYKYNTIAAIRSKFEEIMAYNKKNVALYKHRDGEPYKDADDAPVLFYMTCTPKNLTTLDYRDVLFIKFRSLKAVDLSNGSAVIPQISEIVMTNSN